MKNREELSRITIQIPKTEHKRLKARAALSGKSMREIILELIISSHEDSNDASALKTATRQTLKDSSSKNLDEQEVRKIAQEIMEEYADVFKKLAQ